MQKSDNSNGLILPNDWNISTIDDVTAMVYRYPTYYSIEYVEKGIPEVRGELLLDYGEIERDWGKYRFISEETAKRFPRVRLEIGDIVMSVRGTIGKIGIVHDEIAGGVITANLIRLAPQREKISPNYFRWVLLSPKFVRELDAASPQTTIKTITAPSLKALKIPLPPLPEQHHISYVLSTVQIAIKQQAQLITLMRELKSALMHKLFAEGLHGEKQKETEIGLVPESWEIKPFEEFTTLQRGKDLTKKEFKEGSVPVAGSNGVIGYHDTSFVKGPGVTVGRSGSVGRVTLYDQDFWAHNTSLYVKDFHDNDPRFAAYYLEVMNLARFKTGASVPTLDRNSFKLMPVAVPPREEQVEIRHILETTDKKIEITNLWKAKLEELFRTLLHQLMTGQIRVNEIDLPGIP